MSDPPSKAELSIQHRLHRMVAMLIFELGKNYEIVLIEDGEEGRTIWTDVEYQHPLAGSAAATAIVRRAAIAGSAPLGATFRNGRIPSGTSEWSERMI
jgi:hypothetical protein